MKYFKIMDKMFKDFKEYKEIPKGKGIRGKLVTIIDPNAHKLAAIVESIHLASLLHDDVIDEASIRRGVDSINAKYGKFSAIMLGDIIYSKAFYELIEFDKKIAKAISNAVYLLSQGEMEDVKLSEKINLDKDRYMQMIYKKTASLIEATCVSAAISAGFDENDFRIYGRNIGMAFQIVDDLLDITQDEKTLKKPSMYDFYEGKTTLPYIYLFEVLEDSDKEILKSLYKKSLDDNEKKWIREKMKENRIIDRCFNEAKELIKEAKEAIKKYNIKELEIIADKIVDRKF